MKFALVPFLKRRSPTILTILGVFGTIATGVLAAKDTPKALQRKYDAEEEKGEPLTKVEVVAAMAPAYVPATAVCFSTILCIVGSNKLNKQKQAAIMGAYTMLKNVFNDYRKQAEIVFGENADHDIQQSIEKSKEDPDKPINWSELRTFCLEFDGIEDANCNKLFTRTMEEVFTAQYQFNKLFVQEGFASLNDFYKMMDLPDTADGDSYGWSYEAGTDYGYFWVDFCNEKTTTDDGFECIHIYALCPPIYDYMNYGDPSWVEREKITCSNEGR